MALDADRVIVRNESTIPTLTALVEGGNGKRVIEGKQYLETNVGAHGNADVVVLNGRALGLTIDHQKAGSWFNKKHVLFFKGEAIAALAWFTWMEGMKGATG